MYKPKFVATEETVKALLDEFVEEVARSTGKNGGRPRFANFIVVEGIKQTFVDAVNAFKAGNFVYAHKQAMNAVRGLRGAQRAYCMNSTAVFFPMRVNGVVETIDEHISAQIVKMFEDFKHLVTVTMSHDNFDLDRASTAYWQLLDAIEDAPVKQEALEANRRMLAKAGKASKKQARRLEKEAEEARRADEAKATAALAREARDRARAKVAESYLSVV